MCEWRAGGLLAITGYSKITITQTSQENVDLRPTRAKNREKSPSETLSVNISLNPDLNYDPIFIILTKKKKKKKVEKVRKFWAF